MKTLDAGLASHIIEGVTTLAWCWKVTRADATVQGFTDHDLDLVFDGVTYKAASGFTASQIQSTLGLAVDNLEVSGALVSDTLNEDDLAAGKYDHAQIEIWRVNWANPTERVLMRKGWLGEIKRGKQAFTAEINGLAQALNQPVGRSFTGNCDADLGDARCTIDLTDPTFNGSGAVADVTDNRRFTVTGIDSFDADFFARGKLTWTGGNNDGVIAEIKRHGKVDTLVSIELWFPASADIQSGDTFTITAGCNKTFATCKSKFDNVLNFRGHGFRIPGNDSVIAPPVKGTEMDGGSYYGN